MAVVENRSRLILSALAFFSAALVLSAYSARNEWTMRLGANLVGEAIRPVQYLVHSIAEKSGGAWSHYVWLIDTKGENDRLLEKLEALEAENSRLLERESEVRRLREIVRAVEEKRVEGIAADVIGYDPSNWVRAVTVDKGSLHGIAAGMAVIDGDAAVGQVIAVSPNTSRVLLLTDHASAIDAIVQASRARGVVHGVAKDYLELRYVMQEDPIALGDRLVTSGMDGIFPKGITIGVVSELRKVGAGMFQGVRLKPAADINKLETVLIVTEGAPEQELSPAKPESGKTGAAKAAAIKATPKGETR